MANFLNENSQDKAVISEFNTFITQYDKLGFLPEIERKHAAHIVQTVHEIDVANLNIPLSLNKSITPWPNVWVSWSNNLNKTDTDEEQPVFETPKFR